MIPLSVDSIKTLAQKMNFVSFDTLQIEDQAIQSHWYRHEDGIELYYFQKEDGRIIKLHMAILGQIIEWNPMDGTRTGLMVEQEYGSEVTETIHYDARANNTSVAQSVVLIENANCISEKLRQELVVLLQHTQKTLRPAPSLWSRFKKRFRRA